MLNKILIGILLIAIAYNLITIIINCKIINSHINKNIIENFRYTCSKNQTGNGSDGYQCTIGCGDGKEGRYPYSNMFDAEEGCIKRGFRGLCSRQELIDGMASNRLSGKGQCCAGYTSDIHQSGPYFGRPVIGYDRTSEDSKLASQQEWRNPWCGGEGRNFKGWHPGAKAGAHCCGSNKYDDLALEYKKRSDVMASLFRVGNKITELNKQNKEAEELNEQAKTLTNVYDSLTDGHIKKIQELCTNRKNLFQNFTDTKEGNRKKAIFNILDEEKKKINEQLKRDKRNLKNTHDSKMKEEDDRLQKSVRIKNKILDLSKQTFIDARACSNNTNELVVPSLISANLIPDNENSTINDPKAVVVRDDTPDSELEDNQTSIAEKAISVSEYSNL